MFHKSSRNLRNTNPLHAVLLVTAIGAASMGPAAASASTIGPAPADSRAGIVHVDPDAHADDVAAAGLTTRATQDTSHRLASAKRDNDRDDWSPVGAAPEQHKGAIVGSSHHSMGG